MSKYGLISRIQHFSTDDGEGIRTTVFMQGCKLYCKWCHNPETLSTNGSLLVYYNKCIGCGMCEKICPVDAHKVNSVHEFFRERCTLCGKCVSVCPEKAIEHSGIKMSVSQVFDEIAEDSDFYRNGGGVTISGGEPLLQADFVAALAKKCREHGIGVYIDTAVSCSFSEIEKVLPYTDKFLADFKAATPEKMRTMTGADCAGVLNNIHKLLQRSRVLIRIPVIPGYNDSAEEIGMAADAFSGAEVQLLPFHKLASSKYRAMEAEYAYAECKTLTTKKINELKEILTNKGVFVL